MSDSKAPAAAKGKTFKPRAGIVRKTKAEREAHQKQEAEKAALRAAATQSTNKPSQTAKPGASKKRESTRDNRDAPSSAAGGVFGAGTGAKQAWRKSVLDGGRSEMLDGQEGIRPGDGPSLQGQEGFTGDAKRSGGGGGGSGGGRGTKMLQDGTMIESDDEPDEQRRDIERIWISSDEEDAEHVTDTNKGKARALSEGRKAKSSGGLRPVRAPRMLIEEADTIAEEKTDKKPVKSSRTVIEDADGDEGADEMQIDDQPMPDPHIPKPDIPSSPELARRGKPGRKATTKVKENKYALETVEERAERIRLNDDVEKLREEFVLAPKIKKQDDVEMQDSGLRPDGKLFLFQFPPLIPYLADPTAVPSASLDGGQSTTEAGPNIKSDPDGPSVETENDQADAQSKGRELLTAKDEFRLPAGLVGKLKVHKSGKVTLDWGGTDMEVRYGTEVDFLQDAVLVETPNIPSDENDKPTTSQSGTAYALGQVQKKMVVIPDWQKLYE